ncbi:MAG TPA: hypothetical protein DDZ81_07575 [Acetobacteraceae bacterium]|jgi:hypothetical protein|nr:hypothetical protein [Acetobacteraceae bacterium]
MLLDQVTAPQMQTAQVLTGVTMAAFLAASLFGKRAATIRVAVAGLYIAAALGFLLYFTI